MSNKTTQPAPTQKKESIWDPLQNQVFRVFWIAAIINNTGGWLQNVGATLHMVEMSSSPTMIAMIQTATSLPFFLLALPAGALSDVYNKRKILLFSNTWLMVVCALLALFTYLGFMSPWLLLGFTFLVGVGSAFSGPSFQAAIPEMVSEKDLPSSLTLSSVAVNIARAIGPAVGGLLVAWGSVSFNYLINAISFVFIIIVMYRWKNTVKEKKPNDEKFVEAIKNGVVYIKNAPIAKSVLWRNAIVIVSAAAFWALSPVRTQKELMLSSEQYGILMAFMGAGALLVVNYLVKLRNRYTSDWMVNAGALIFAISTAAIAWATNYWVLAAIHFIAGIGWILVMSTFNVAIQKALPKWVLARGMSIYMLIFQGGLAVGSALWGYAAGAFPLSWVLMVASGLLLLSLLAGYVFKIQPAMSLLNHPANSWPEPGNSIGVADNHKGRVMISVTYQIKKEDEAAFVKAIELLRKERMRSGAQTYMLTQNIDVPGEWTEFYSMASWAQHLREHDNHTESDALVQKEVYKFHQGSNPPVVRHFVEEE